MKRIQDFCDLTQKQRLAKIREAIEGFYKGNDNRVTYALTGLLNELCNAHYNDPHYLQEKLDIIIRELREGTA